MNRKIMWVMIAAVAALLPAVAVADVMITGNMYGNSTSVPDAFYVQDGPNYASAHNLAGLTWQSKTNSESEILGTVTVGYMSNETITEINVLDINFTGSGTFYFNVTIPHSTTSMTNNVFSTGSLLYISSSPETFASPGSQIKLDNSGTFSLHFTVSSSTTLYLGFVVGPESYGATFSVVMNLIAP